MKNGFVCLPRPLHMSLNNLFCTLKFQLECIFERIINKIYKKALPPPHSNELFTRKVLHVSKFSKSNVSCTIRLITKFYITFDFLRGIDLICITYTKLKYRRSEWQLIHDFKVGIFMCRSGESGDPSDIDPCLDFVLSRLTH